MQSSIGGCAGGQFRVRPVPSTPEAREVEGFRYYLPKPYLLVTNMTLVPTVTAQAPKSDSSGEPAPLTQLSAQLIWLPDTKERYSVSVEGGKTGTFKGSLQLTNGWMLVAVNEEFDTKTEEILKDFTGLLPTLLTAAGLPTTPKGLAARATTTPTTPFLYLFEIDLQNKKLVPLDTTELKNVLGGLGLTVPQGTRKPAQ